MYATEMIKFKSCRNRANQDFIRNPVSLKFSSSPAAFTDSRVCVAPRRSEPPTGTETWIRFGSVVNAQPVEEPLYKWADSIFTLKNGNTCSPSARTRTILDPSNSVAFNRKLFAALQTNDRNPTIGVQFRASASLRAKAGTISNARWVDEKRSSAVLAGKRNATLMRHLDILSRGVTHRAVDAAPVYFVVSILSGLKGN